MLHTLDSFEFSGATLSLIKDVDATIAEIDQRRPIPSEITEHFFKELNVDRIFSSAVTEGNRLTRRETIVLLSSGVIHSTGHKDIIEIKNLSEAVIQLQNLLQHDEEIAVTLVRELHKTILKGVNDNEAGVYRNGPVEIKGAKIRPPASSDVPELVRQICTCIQENLEVKHPIQLAAWAHWALTRVHPFSDGNGRLARLIQDYVLLRRHYLPVPLYVEDRERNYYDALEEADQGNPKPFIELIAKNMLKVADRYLAAIKDTEAKEQWINDIAKIAKERIKETEHRSFILWQRRIDTIRNEFREIGTSLCESIPDLVIEFRNYGGIDFEKYRTLRAGTRTSKTWIFGIRTSFKDIEFRFVFWAGIHFAKLDDPLSPEEFTEPVLLVSMEQDKYYHLLDDLNEHAISIRELAFGDFNIARKRYVPSEDITRDHYEWDLKISPSKIARDFFSEVLQRLYVI